jgi:competence protein ComEC
MKISHRKIIYIFAGLLICIFLLSSFFVYRADGKLHIVFCDVGQGDAIYIRFPDGRDGLIDGGPINRVLRCIGKHMAFWDRTIEFVVLTHPHEDHFKGIIEVLKRYKVETIIVPVVENAESLFYADLVKQIISEKALVKNLYQGNKVEFTFKESRAGNHNSIVFTSLWPTKDWVADNTISPLTDGVMTVKTTYKDLNDFSQVFQLSYGQFDVLFTGDAEKDTLQSLVDKDFIPQNTIEIIKVPHQGNKNALSEKLVSYIRPQLGVVMVGKNSYGHPDKQTINMLESEGAIVKRTDKDGDVEIVSDGREFQINGVN